MSKRPKLTSAQRALVTAFTALAGDAPDAAAFIAQAAEDAAPDELPELPGKALAALLADFWAFAATRKGEAPIIRLAPVEGAPAPPYALPRQDPCLRHDTGWQDQPEGCRSSSRSP